MDSVSEYGCSVALSMRVRYKLRLRWPMLVMDLGGAGGEKTKVVVMEFRVATYNIHKGVQGVGVMRRLEIHHLRAAVARLDADIIGLQEVRKFCSQSARHFSDWPAASQAEYLAPEGYHALYVTNAVTRYGEHGNAVLSRWPIASHRHQDISDHRFEQRGFLHAMVDTPAGLLHTIVVHLGLIAASRLRQLAKLQAYIASEIPANEPVVLVGDFNDWSAALTQKLATHGLVELASSFNKTFPARLPLAQLDHIYVRGLQMLRADVVRGAEWSRMSDHLPLTAAVQW